MFLRLQLHWGTQQSTQAAHAPASPLGPSNATISVPQNAKISGGVKLNAELRNTCSRPLNLDVSNFPWQKFFRLKSQTE
jgi:hypothetical protein